MPESRKYINICTDDYDEEGLYLIFPDSTRLTLTTESILRIYNEFWKDLSKVPIDLKKIYEYPRCKICPLGDKTGLCRAFYPLVPFLKELEKYLSFDKTIAIYKGAKEGSLFIKDTTLQDALKSVSILSLMYYCHVGIKYGRYFYGIMPLMDVEKIASRLYLNIFWFHNGKENEINRVISQFNEELRNTSKNIVERLNLICKSDAFMNAFVITQITTERLTTPMKDRIKKEFDDFIKHRMSVDKQLIDFPDDVLETWQKGLNYIAEQTHVPAALIMSLSLPYIKVFLRSESKKNPYKIGSVEHLLGSGLYCERVFKTKDKLLVPNALKDKDWDKNPDIKLRMISYLGFPILWPDGEVFGTICILDSKENRYRNEDEKLVLKFKEYIESYLSLALIKYLLRSKYIDYKKGSKELQKKELRYRTLLNEIIKLLPKK